MSWRVQPQTLEEFNKFILLPKHPFQAAEGKNENFKEYKFKISYKHGIKSHQNTFSQKTSPIES